MSFCLAQPSLVLTAAWILMSHPVSHPVSGLTGLASAGFSGIVAFYDLQIQDEESVVLFLVAWTVTEITRYSFYTFSLLDHLPYFIKWARWQCFAVLCFMV